MTRIIIRSRALGREFSFWHGAYKDADDPRRRRSALFLELPGREGCTGRQIMTRRGYAVYVTEDSAERVCRRLVHAWVAARREMA